MVHSKYMGSTKLKVKNINLLEEVSIAELRAKLPKFIKLAQSGNLVRITNFKKPVAILAPLPPLPERDDLTYQEAVDSPVVIWEMAKLPEKKRSFSALAALKEDRED